MRTIKVGSDFSGIGSFDFAVNNVGKKKGFQVLNLFACDIDKHAQTAYLANHEKPINYFTDVYEREIPKCSLDIYMTSPPCQAFSVAGKRMGKEDERGILFFNSLEFIRENKPRFFIFENVKGLLSDDGGRTFGEWVRLLGGKSVDGLPVLFPDADSVPYHVYSKVLDAKNYNAPQQRNRVFIIGIRDDGDNSFTFPRKQELKTKLIDVLETDVDAKYYMSEKAIEGFKVHKRRNLENGNNFGAVISDPLNTEYSNTIRARYYKDGSEQLLKFKKPESNAVEIDLLNENFLDHYEIRKLTPRECLRLFGFPETFKQVVSDSQTYKQCGNSIVINVLESIIEKLNL